ncbi:hypothetical protein SMG44B_10215 [Stenotrophomonas maltophilia]|nr:hypothetical protein BN126360022 [Stenotrophomonas maltophilia]
MIPGRTVHRLGTPTAAVVPAAGRQPRDLRSTVQLPASGRHYQASLWFVPTNGRHPPHESTPTKVGIQR